jgi:hypothetical protein
MKTAELDFNAIPITAPRARQLLQTKFKALKTDYLFSSRHTFICKHSKHGW